MIDGMPELLEFFLIEILVELVFLYLGCMTIFDDTIKSMFIKDALYQLMDAFCHIPYFLRK